MQGRRRLPYITLPDGAPQGFKRPPQGGHAPIPVEEPPLKPLPAWCTPIDLEAEEKRSQLVDALGDRFERLIEKSKASGDPLIKIGDAVAFVACPEWSTTRLLQRFQTAADLGHFPTPHTGFIEEPGRRAIRDLIDLHSIREFSAGDYPLQPSRATVAAAGPSMHVQHSVFRKWLTAIGCPVPVELQKPEPAAEPAPPPAAVPVSQPPAAPQTAQPPPLSAHLIKGQGLYDNWVTTNNGSTTTEGDIAFGTKYGFTRLQVKSFRKNNPTDSLHAKHRPKKK